MRIKAGALYFSIVVALFIAIVSASLIMLAAHYRNSYLKEIRYNRLLNNLESGITYVLNEDNRTENIRQLDLYGDQLDSIELTKKSWGIFDLAILKTFVQQDTLKRTFLIGNETDSIALYLSDEDRPLSVSGQTKITGDVLLPKSGIRQSYAEGKPYAGGKQLIYNGKISNSKRTLPNLDEELLKKLKTNLENSNEKLSSFANKDLKVSFLDSTTYLKLPQYSILSDVSLKGNIVLYADSSITITSSAHLDNVQLYAPVIKVEEGFKGNCQLFARDSIVVANQAVFEYPSVLGVIRTDKSGTQPKIALGNQVRFNGIIFSYEDKRSALQTMISLGKNTKVKGEVYSTGLFKIEKESSVEGKVSCNRFIMQSPVTLYENFLIDVAFNRKARSEYYLSSPLFKAKKQNKVLKWLN